MQIKWPILLFLVLLAGIAFWVFYAHIENFFVFFPRSSHDSAPDDLGLTYRDVFIETGEGARLHGWFFPLGKKGPVYLFCHGNAGNISHRLENVRLLLDRGLQVFIFDYRGYGRSTGWPSEAGIYRDGLAAYDYLVQQAGIPPDDIIAFGRSLGAAVALEVALQREVRSLIMESAFTSTRDMAKTMPLFGLLAPLFPAHYNNLGKISGIRVPKLLIHGRDDEIVPYTMLERLFASASAPKYLYAIDGAGHNDTYTVGGQRYFDNLEEFTHHGFLVQPHGTIISYPNDAFIE